MGNYYSKTEQAHSDDKSNSTIRIMSYNVEWGFLKLPLIMF